MQDIVSQLVTTLPRIIIAVLILILFWILSKLAASFLDKVAKTKLPQHQPIFYFMQQVSKITILVVGMITALGSAGVNISALVASLGLSGLALTIASKDAFSNMLAGVMVLFYQPFKIGDTIQVGRHVGIVTKMSLRYTHIQGENKEILIPNSTLLTNHIVILTN
jgi:small-conductance mechanosensitive channel